MKYAAITPGNLKQYKESVDDNIIKHCDQCVHLAPLPSDLKNINNMTVLDTLVTIF